MIQRERAAGDRGERVNRNEIFVARGDRKAVGSWAAQRSYNRNITKLVALRSVVIIKEA